MAHVYGNIWSLKRATTQVLGGFVVRPQVRAMNLVNCILNTEQGIVRHDYYNSLPRVECACSMITGILLTSSCMACLCFHLCSPIK